MFKCKLVVPYSLVKDSDQLITENNIVFLMEEINFSILKNYPNILKDNFSKISSTEKEKKKKQAFLPLLSW